MSVKSPFHPDSIPLFRSPHPRRPWWKRIGGAFFRFLGDVASQFSNDPLDRCRWMKFPSVRKSVSDRPEDRLSRAGEEEAVRALREKGFRLLHRNIRFPGLGELDIVARDGSTLVFVEVKTRRHHEQGASCNVVTTAQQKRQVAMAGRFISLCKLRDVPIRFDIVVIVWPEHEPPRFEYWKDAFRPNDFIR